jgi:hypothetical protein
MSGKSRGKNSQCISERITQRRLPRPRYSLMERVPNKKLKEHRLKRYHRVLL